MTTVQRDIDVKGAFARKPTTFRHKITATGPTTPDSTDFPAEPNRYLLYVSLACPWACRTLAVRQIKGLEDVIGVAVVAAVFEKTKPEVDEHTGWVFRPALHPANTVDPVFGAHTLREVYDKSIEGLEGVTVERFTVPILFDTKTKRIVNNESSEIIRMLNSEFNAFAKYPEIDLYPVNQRPAIDAVNESVYESVNNGVYKCGFAQSQEAYDHAVGVLYHRLDELDAMFAKQRFLIPGGKLTEADVRLFVTLVRFDDVYVVHFKCSKKFIREYPHLSGYMRDVSQTGRIANTVNLDHIKHHYFASHRSINVYGIVPVTQPLDLTSSHGREALA